MAEELQGLLNRIREDGLEKTEAERAKIIADAEAKAAEIIAEADRRAAETVKKAEESSAMLEEKAKASIRQAARDIVIALKSEMQERLRSVTKNCIGQAMTPDLMAYLIAEMAKNYTATGSDKIQVLLSDKSLADLASGILNGLGQDFASRTKILGEPELGSGFQIGFHDGEVFLDFSDEALTDLICSYVGAKLTAILKN